MLCRKCGVHKPADAFHASRRSKCGEFGYSCRDCYNSYRSRRRAEHGESERAKARETYAADPERRLERQRARRARNPEKCRELERVQYANNIEMRRVMSVAKRLGLSHSLALRMRKRNCEICGAAPDAEGDAAHHIDHDHSVTGPASVRGTLCARCNLTLGRFEMGQHYGLTKRPEWSASATRYLERYESRLTVTATTAARRAQGGDDA